MRFTTTGSHYVKLAIVAMTMLSIVGLSTCKSPLVGLGGQVDLEAPRSITVSPGAGSYRSGVITISGTTLDAYGLASADVRILDRGSGVELAAFSTTVSGTAWTTGATVNTAIFPDGLYNVAITLKDARGNSSEDRVLLGFDNRAPTVVLEEPLDLSLEYNGAITVSGQAYDANSSIVSVSVELRRNADNSLVGAALLSATVPKWSVIFNTSVLGLSFDEDLRVVVIATDEGGNVNTFQYEYKELYENNDLNPAPGVTELGPVTASLVDTLEAQALGTATISGLAFDKATLATYRKDNVDATPPPITPTLLKVNSSSDQPTFVFVTPDELSTSEAAAEYWAGGTKATGTVSDDDLNTADMAVSYRYVPVASDINTGSWSVATVAGNPGFEQRWSFNLPAVNGSYKLQLRGQDNGSATGYSAVKYFKIDDGKPLVNIDTALPVAWKLYYGANQTILVTGEALRSGGTIGDVEIAVGGNPWTNITGLTGLGTDTVTWSSYPLSLSGLAGGSTQVRVRAQDNNFVWGQGEILIIMDVDAPDIAFNDPGSNMNGNVTFRGTVDDGGTDAFITVLDKVEAKFDSGVYTQITGTYSWSWFQDTRLLSDGAHTLWIKAYDTAGNFTEESLAISVDQTTNKPSVAVNNLTAAQVIGGSYIISGTAADDDGVATAADGIQIFIENENTPGNWVVAQTWTDIPSRTGSPVSYSWTYTLPALSSGSYRLTLRSRDLNSVVGNYGSAVLPQANYWYSTGTLAFSVDNDVPVVNQADFSHDSGSYVNDDILIPFTLEGTVTEDKSLGSVRVFINGTDRGAAAIGGSVPTYTFSFTVNKAWLTDGANSIRVDATDQSSPAKTGSGTIQIILDKAVDAPTVAYLTPDNASTVNGLITISGTATDNNQISALYYLISSLGTPPVYPTGYTLLTGKYSFNFIQNTALLTDDTAYKVYLVAVDGAGNTMALSPEILDLTVDQDSDRPIIKLSNIDPDGVPALTTLKLASTVFGSVSDDDGTITLFRVSEDGSSWTTVPLSGGTFSYNSSAGDTTKTLYFEVTDKVGKVFTTAAGSSANKPRVENGAIGVYIETTVSYKVDTNFPDVYSTVRYDAAAPLDMAALSDLTSTSAFGGSASGQFKLRVYATDANGIASVSVSVPGAAGSPFPATLQVGTDSLGGITYNRYDTGTIDVTALTDATIAMTLTVTDNSGLATPVSKNIGIDNTVPTYTFINPANNQVVNGDITVTGTAVDASSGLVSVKYQLGYNSDIASASPGWANVAGTIYNWEIDLTGANRSDLYAGKTSTVDPATDYVASTAHGFADGTVVYFSATTLPTGISSATAYYVRDAAANQFKVSLTNGGVAVNITTAGSEVTVSAEARDTDNDQIWDFPIMIRAEDRAGNVAITALGAQIIKLDPGGDRPRVTVYYPDAPGKTLGGSIRVYGLASDDDAVDSVFMQVDVDDDGLFTALDIDSTTKDWYNGGLGQLVNGSANWYQVINASQEFDPVSGTNTISIRLRAKDIYGTYGPWTAAQSIIIDKNVPQFGSQSALVIDPDNTAGNGNSQAYTVGMYVAGNTVYLRGSITDDGSISAITVTGAVAGTFATPAAIDLSGWFTAGYAGQGYDMAIPVVLDAGASGSKQITITAYDNNATARESIMEIRFNYDNQAPSATLNAAVSPAVVAQSNGWYKVKGTAEDIGSDVDRVEVYFVRRDRANPYPAAINTATARIYNPAAQNTSAMLNTVNWTAEYPTLQGTATRGSTTTMTHAALIGNTMIQLGQKVLVGTNLRTISVFDIGNGTITWTGGIVDLGTTSYTIRLGLQVDHKDYIESSAAVSGTVTRVGGEEKYFTAAALVNNNDISVGDMVRINGEYRVVSTWNKAAGRIDWTGANVTVGVGQAYEVLPVINDDADHYVEYFKQDSGITYTWSVDVKSDAIPDGPIEIHYMVYDNAGNSAHYQTIAYKIQNNGPRFASVILGSDLDGSGTVTAGEKEPAYDFNSATAASETKAFGYTVKDGPMYIEPVITNGNGDLKLWMTGAYVLGGVPGYALRTTGVMNPVTLADGDLATMGDGSKTFTMSVWDSTEETTVGTDSLNIIRGATITVDYVDSVVPTAAVRPFYWNGIASNSLYSNSTVNGHIEITGVYGGVDPDVSGQISFRGTAYDDQRITALYAFVGPATTATFPFTGGTTKPFGAYTYTRLGTYLAGVWTPVDQWAANGWKSTITDRGLTQDGHRIDWQLDIDSSRITGVAAADQILRVIAEDRATSQSIITASANTLTGTATRPSNISLAVTPNASIKAGQLVILGAGEQAYASRIASYTAGTIVLNDAIDTGVTAYTIYLDAHQSPLYQVDVVPYITGIANSANKGLANTVLRGANGTYSMDIDTDTVNNRMQVSGFNFGVAASARISPAVITAPSGEAPAVTYVSASSVTIAKTFTNGRSGYLTVFVNSVPSINNLSNNSLMANMENDDTKSNTALWTDDRFLWFWAQTTVLPLVTNQTFYYPSMVMNVNQPLFAYANNNNGYTYRTSDDATTAQKTGVWFARNAVMAKTSTPTYFMVSNEDNFTGGSAGFLYVALADNFANAMIGNSVVASGTGVIELAGVEWDGTALGGGAASRQLNRFMYPSLIASGAGGSAQLLVSYFDAHPSVQQIQFFAFKQTGANTTNLVEPTNDQLIASNGNMMVSGTKDASSQYTAMDYLPGSFAAATVVAATDVFTSGVGDHGYAVGDAIYFTATGYPGGINGTTTYFIQSVPSSTTFTISATKGGGVLNITSAGTALQYYKGSRVVIAYFDPTDGTGGLKMAYAGAAIRQDGLADTAASWATLLIDGSALTGANLSMTRDASYYYIAYADGGKADLKLVTIDVGTMAVVSTQVIDSYQSVGIWTNIKLVNGLPYITYYNNSYNGTKNSIKMAFPVAANARTAAQNVFEAGANAVNERFTGNWDVISIPAKTVPAGGKEEFTRTMLDTYVNNLATVPVVAWLGTPRIEYAKLQPNN